MFSYEALLLEKQHTLTPNLFPGLKVISFLRYFRMKEELMTWDMKLLLISVVRLSLLYFLKSDDLFISVHHIYQYSKNEL